ncbi:unnamed protein product [Penicillium pancosmium]
MADRANQNQTLDIPEGDNAQASQLIGTQLPSRSCAQCRNSMDPLTPCSKCDMASYCSKMCQKLHWLEHKYSCRLGRPLDEADDFVLACQREEFPTDELVANAFGFMYFASAAGRKRIFNIYCQLLNIYEVTEDEFREAWRRNKLKEFLLFRGSQIPSSALQREMGWLQQQDGFAAGAVHDSSQDRKISFDQWEPREKAEAYIFFYQI